MIGCGGGEHPPPAKPQPVLPPPSEPTQSTYISPAKWSFHPHAPSKATAAHDLGDGSCLVTTFDGLRVRTTKFDRSPTGAVTCGGRMTVAADVAPEPLVGLVERKGASWLFVGSAGNLYEAEGPLTPFQRIIPNPTKFAKVAGNANTIMAVATNGQLFRLDASSSWRAIPLPDSNAFDVGVSNAGETLVLGLPEKLYASKDGQTFIDVSNGLTVGAQKIVTTAEGHLAAWGLTGTLAWDPQKNPAISRLNDALASQSAGLDLEPFIIPSASPVVEGRAVLDGDRYVEAVGPEEENGTWSLARGTFEGPLTSAPLPGTEGCTVLRLGARGRFMTILCIKPEESDVATALVRTSSDGGTKFGEWSRFIASNDDLSRVAVASDGTTLVTGVCHARPGASGCQGSPPMLLQVTNGAVSSTLAAAPPLMGLPISPAFSADGKSAYFLARRAKDERLALFVSHDGGRAFAERSLSSRATSEASGGSEEGDEGAPNEESFDPSDLTTVRPSDDGMIGMVLTTSRGLSYLTTDDDGRVLGMAQAPVEQAMMGGFGRRVIAVSSSPDTTRGSNSLITAWESDDGGLNWNELSTTRSLVRELFGGPMTAACSSAGCLVGTTITRVGWQGQADAPSVVKPSKPELHRVNAVRTPLVCTLDQNVPWKRIDHVWTGPPTISSIARGRALWSMLSFDPTTNVVSTTVAQWPDRGEGPARVTTRTLLGPTPKGTDFAVDISRQIEGYVASRVRVPESGKSDVPMRNVEVAWENFFDGTSKQTTIPDAGVFEDGDIKAVDDVRFFEPVLVSVTAGGVFIRPHARDSSDNRLFLLDAKGKRTNPVFPDWKDVLSLDLTNLHGDMAVVEGKPIAIGTVGSSGEDDHGPLTLIIAQAKEGGLSKTTATALLPPSNKEQERLLNQDWTYRGPTEVGVVGLESEPEAGWARAAFFPFRADGTFTKSIELATPFDLPTMPRPCKSDERRTTPRLAGYAMTDREVMFPGTRHPVLVTEVQKDKLPVGDPMVLLTWSTVLHGTKESPCVAAWEAYGVGSSGLVAVISGDPSQAFLFRHVENVASPPGRDADQPSLRRTNMMFEHRPMACRFDSSALIPETVWSQPGTFRMLPK